MEFEIKEKIVVENPYKNCYVVECGVSHGDGDKEDTMVIGGFNKGEEGLLADLVETLTRLSDRDLDRYDYNDVDGFDRWFQYDDLEDEEIALLPEKIKSLNCDWETDIASGDGYAAYSYHVVYYYDELGYKYFVNVIK